jgi:hypothetical protein
MSVPKRVKTRVVEESTKVFADLRGRDPEFEWHKAWLKLYEQSKLTEVQWLDKRNKLLTDLKYFLRVFFDLTFSGNLLTREVHGPLIDQIEDSACFVCDRPQTADISMYVQARDTLKTSIFVPAGMQSVLRDKEERFAVATYDAPQSKARVGVIRDKLATPEARLFFPDSIHMPRGKKQGLRESNDCLDMPNRRITMEGTLQSYSRQAAATGMHPTLVLFDDLVNEDTIRSQLMMRNVRSVWDYLVACVARNFVGWVVGTFYGDDDLYHSILSDGVISKLWVVPAVMTENWIRDYPEMQPKLKFDKYEPGTLMFPNRLDDDTLHQKRKLHGAKVYASQFLLDPGFESSALKEEWLQVFTDGEEPDDMAYYMTADPGTSTHEGASESALCCAGFDWKGQCWIVDLDKGLWSPRQFADHAVSMYKRWMHRGFLHFGMEKISFQAYAHELIRQVAQEDGVEIRVEDLPGHNLGIFGRVQQLVVAANANWVHCRRELIPIILPQWKSYPDPTGRRMDMLDAVAYLFATWTTGKKKGKKWVVLPDAPRAAGPEKAKTLPPSQRPKTYLKKMRGWWSVYD